jgi:hypothetical protein
LEELAKGVAGQFRPVSLQLVQFIIFWTDGDLMSILTEEEGSMKFSMMRRSHAEQEDPSAAQQLEYILPNYFGPSSKQ